MKIKILFGLWLGCMLMALNACDLFEDSDPVSASGGLRFYTDVSKYQEALDRQGSMSYSDQFAVESVVREDDLLKITVMYGGGCNEHTFDLIWDGTLLKSYPAQARMFLKHEDHSDKCDALVRKTLVFNVRDKMGMPGKDVRITIINASNKQSHNSN